MKRKLIIIAIIAVPVLLSLAGAVLALSGGTQSGLGVRLLAFGALLEAVLIGYGIKSGVTNYIMLSRTELEMDKMRKRFEVESLYTPMEHTDEWLQGFALSMEYFVDNYLSKESAGPNEEMFWQLCRREASNEKERMAYSEDAYRQYMIQSLLFRNGITTEEFMKIIKMVTKDTVKETLSEIAYMKEFVQMTVDERKEMAKQVQSDHEKK